MKLEMLVPFDMDPSQYELALDSEAHRLNLTLLRERHQLIDHQVVVVSDYRDPRVKEVSPSPYIRISAAVSKMTPEQITLRDETRRRIAALAERQNQEIT